MEESSGYVFLHLSKPISQEEVETLTDIKSAIGSVGCWLSFMMESNKDGVDETVVLAINYEKNKNARNAGRNKKLVARQYWGITCGDVRKMIEEKGLDATASELKVSRATLYRRIKGKDDSAKF